MNNPWKRGSLLLLAVLVLLPIDWFSPTGQLLREAGAKPINVLLLAVGGFLLLNGRSIFKAKARLPVQEVFFAIICLGALGFLSQLILLPAEQTKARSPYVQFLFQTGMIALFMIELQVLIYLFRRDEQRQRVLDLLGMAALIQLFFFLLEAAGVFSIDVPGPLALFRSDGLIDRASGLMSEPSYYGTFAALYAVPLLLFARRHPILHRLLALVLLASAYLVQAKTMFIVLAAQLIYLIVFARIRKRNKQMLWAAILLVVPFGFYLSEKSAVLDVGENLSTVMRVGSGVLAWRASEDGYGLFGAGTGQFHFLYTPKYAPDFLTISQEALDQLYGFSDTRASTYNLPLRLLVETGISGLLIFVALIAVTAIKTRRSSDAATITGMCFVSGSLGFLLTQDTYCLPSLAFGLALALTERSRPRDAIDT